MSKLTSHLKQHKKLYLGTVGALLVLAAGAAVVWSCPQAKFKRYCKNKELCVYLSQRLTPAEKETFVAMVDYQKKTGKTDLDIGILKYADLKDITEVNLKTKAASADVARQRLLDNMLPQEKLAGNRDCLRQAYTNELSNEEILFLQLPQAQDINVLKNNSQLRDMYILASSKVMKCMNEGIRQKYLEEIQLLRTPATPAQPQK